MTYKPNIHHRRSIRLKGYDYSQAGLYFVTICCEGREHRFGKIENDEMMLNDAGKIADEYLKNIPQKYNQTQLHEYVVMPNHVHVIIEIMESPYNEMDNSVGAIHESPPTMDDDVSKRSIHETPPTMDDDVSKRAIHELPPTMDDDVSKRAIHESPLPFRDQRRKMLLSKIVGWFKMNTAKQINIIRHAEGTTFWQRNYHEHIIRNEQSYQTISEYIINNPAKWKEDKFYME